VTLRDQLSLSGVSRTAHYYEPIPETAENLLYMEEIDRQYMAHPFYGSRRITAVLQSLGYLVNRKRIIRLMRLMGLQTIYPKRNLSKSAAKDTKYPYLLKGVKVTETDQVWSTDITYIPIKGGFLYLVAIMDWYTRYVLSWKLSNTLDVDFCLDALQEALSYGNPEIFNSDQGSQFTCKRFVEAIESQGIKISMDGRGRCFDNIFVERLWRSIKYEEVYIKRYETGEEAHRGLNSYMEFYNNERPHQSLNYQTPQAIYCG